MYSHILLPIDGSILSMGAASAGIDLAKAIGARVTTYYGLVTPASIMVAEFGAVDAASIDRYEKQMQAESARCFKSLAALAKQQGVELKAVAETIYDPAAGILQAAKKQRCDLIVIGSHGRSALKRLFLGGVAVRLLSQSLIPVLVQKDSRNIRAAGKKLLGNPK